MTARQADLFEKDREVGPRRSVHGGEFAVGKRKVARPLDSRKSLHLVLKSSHAKSKMSLLAAANRLVVQRIIRDRAVQFGVVVQGFELMSNHIHLVVKFRARALFQRFLRTVTGLIARHVTGARRGKPFGERFFDRLAFSRVVHGLRDFRGVINYLAKNELERDVHPLARVEIEKLERQRRRESARRRSEMRSKSNDPARQSRSP